MNQVETIKLMDIVKSPFFVSSTDGRTAYVKAYRLLRSNKKVEIDFGNYTVLAQPFLTALIFSLYGVIKEDILNTHLKFKNVKPNDKELINRTVEWSKQYYKDTEGFNKAVKEE